MHRIFVIAVGIALAPGLLAAQNGRSVFSVGVADAESGAPISGAEVVLPDLRMLARTDANGQVRMPNVPFGTHRVRVRFLGYSASDVQLKFDRDTIGAVFRLGKTSSTLTGVDVITTQPPAQLKDFEVRKKQGIGRFLTQADLVSVADRDFMVVASTKFPGVAIQSDAGNQPHLTGLRSNCGAAASAQSANRGVDRIGQQAGAKKQMGMRDGYEDGEVHGSCESSQACLIQVWLDNINLGESDPALMRTWDLSGVEFYTGNQVPARYRTSGSACGVLLLWSKWT